MKGALTFFVAASTALGAYALVWSLIFYERGRFYPSLLLLLLGALSVVVGIVVGLYFRNRLPPPPPH